LSPHIDRIICRNDEIRCDDEKNCGRKCDGMIQCPDGSDEGEGCPVRLMNCAILKTEPDDTACINITDNNSKWNLGDYKAHYNKSVAAPRAAPSTNCNASTDKQGCLGKGGCVWLREFKTRGGGARNRVPKRCYQKQE
jgi:hypothetical protein